MDGRIAVPEDIGGSVALGIEMTSGAVNVVLHEEKDCTKMLLALSLVPTTWGEWSLVQEGEICGERARVNS